MLQLGSCERERLGEKLPSANGAVSKNVANRLTAAVRQYAQPMGSDGGVTSDGHFVAFQNPLARRDIYRFLDDLAKGMAPTVAP